MSEALLEVVKLNKAFGRVVTARDLNLVLQPGVLTSLIGPNGAGKSTLINLLTGFLAPDSGFILFRGRDITRLPIYRRVRQGLCRSFQVANIFPNLTVLQNVTIPALAARRRSHRLFGRVERETAYSHDANQILERIGLGGAAHSPACDLSHGDQRLLQGRNRYGCTAATAFPRRTDCRHEPGGKDQRSWAISANWPKMG